MIHPQLTFGYKGGWRWAEGVRTVPHLAFKCEGGGGGGGGGLAFCEQSPVSRFDAREVVVGVVVSWGGRGLGAW